MKKGTHFCKKMLAVVLSMIMLASVSVTGFTPVAAAAEGDPYVISRNRPAFASSEKDAAWKAFDGNTGTRWESDWSQPHWIYVDLGTVADITHMRILWEGAYARVYSIQFSNDEANWSTQLTVNNGAAGWVTLDVSGQARYVRVQCDQRGQTAYGFSAFEIEVWGLSSVVPPPEDFGPNLALGKSVEVSSYQTEWNAVYDNVKPPNMTDGSRSTGWHASSGKTDQWAIVDLGQPYDLGRIVVAWGYDCAASYDIDISADGVNWTTAYRELDGKNGNRNNAVRNIRPHVTARYIRVNCYGIYPSGINYGGFEIKELEAYAYKAGDPGIVYDIPPIPAPRTVQVPGSDATYKTDDIRFPQAKYPYFKDDSLQAPIDSNDWWQSMLITDFGNALSVLPLKLKYSTSGLGFITLTEGWYNRPANYYQGDVTSTRGETKIDFNICPDGLDPATAFNKVTNYSDYSVTAQLWDQNGPAMTNTITKGCPYVFTEFGDKREVSILSAGITGIFNDAGQSILTADNVPLTADHIGIEITDNDNKAGTLTSKNWYSICVPEGTVFRKVGGRIRMTFPAADGYMSVGTMTAKDQLNEFYQHGYAFITDTRVDYDFNEATSVVTSYFNVTTQQKRTGAGFSDQTMQCLLPHKWKKSAAAVNSTVTFGSPRGTLKLIESNSFTTSDTFYGMVPQFPTPENPEYNDAVLQSYLARLAANTHNVGGDAYWQGKALHPLSLGALVADQTGNIGYRDEFLHRLRRIFDDWFTYSGGGDDAHFYYDQNWGTIYYRYSEFGVNSGITDHHFTYGYFVFACAVLATYDDDFYAKYKTMVDTLCRDYAGPDRDDPLFCRFRAYDLYEGHSWAGGYADNDDGNNQEAAGESLFGWVGMYLWSVRSGNKALRDAAIFGFTTEVNAIKQYWFNYDGDNWPAGYPSKIAGQVYGATTFFGTFFDGSPVSVYGIHWLPVAEYLTYYGMEQDKIAAMYAGLEADVAGQLAKEMAKENPVPGNIKNPLTNWQHIFVPFVSQFDAPRALSEFAVAEAVHDGNEKFNSYWFANSMMELGVRTTEIYAVGGASASVYKKGNAYTAVIWNPTDESVEVKFTDGNTIVGSAVVGAKGLIKTDPTAMGAVQLSTPKFSIAPGTYDETQYVTITCADAGATIYYTTDGSNPTESSPVYTGQIIPLTTSGIVKAIAVRAGAITSPMATLGVTIRGSSVSWGPNLALRKTVTASASEGGAANVPANLTDGKPGTKWGSAFSDYEWAYVDLGQNYNINQVRLLWQPTAYAKRYNVQVATSAAGPWTTVVPVANGTGGYVEFVFEPVLARYVRIECFERSSAYGHSIYELGVYEARKIATPQFSLPSGTYGETQLVSIDTATKGVEIRYTADGSVPTQNSPLYMPQIPVWQNVTLKAAAFRTGMMASDVATVTYTVTDGVQGITFDPYDDFAVDKEEDTAEDDIRVEAGTVTGGGNTDPVTASLAYRKTAVFSSQEGNATATNIQTGAVTDGNVNTGMSTNFGATYTGPDKNLEWIYVDLGSPQEIGRVTIYWAGNTPNNQYYIQVSDDAQTWTTVATHAAQNVSIDHTEFSPVTARYVKMQGIRIGAAWGYNMYQFCVYAPAVLPASVSLSRGNFDLSVNETAAVTATVNPENTTDKTVVWTSSNENIATVKDGVIKGVAPGTAVITVKASAGTNVSASLTVSVKGRLVTPFARVNKTADNQITLNWDSIPNAAGYTVYRRLASSPDYAMIAQNVTGGAYVDGDLGNGVYLYKIIAISNNTNYLDSRLSDASARTTIGSGEAPELTFVVSGLVTSYNPNNITTIQLMQGGVEKYAATIAAEAGSGQKQQSFFIGNVLPGDYTLVITKGAHTIFTVETITVNKDLDLTKDSRAAVQNMTLLCGDISKDGMINDGDLALLWLASNYNKSAADLTVNALCDLNGDGMINDGDLAILWLAVNYNKGAVIVP